MTIQSIAILTAASLAVAGVTVANRTKIAAWFPAKTQQTAAPVVERAAWSPGQLDNLVAPVALYPDSLLGQVLVACGYPLQITEASQWLQRTQALQGAELANAAQQQNWDASVAALVAFPEVLSKLGGNISWTSDLGQAFQTQRADVMDAIQRLRARAKQAGRLTSTAEWTVITEVAGAANIIEIQTSEPNLLYVPVYDPVCVWGAPVWGAYPVLVYSTCGLVFAPAVEMDVYFTGWHGWAAWGWRPVWFAHSVFVDRGFFARGGFHAPFRGGFQAAAIPAARPAGAGFAARNSFQHPGATGFAAPMGSTMGGRMSSAPRFSSGAAGRRFGSAGFGARGFGGSASHSFDPGLGAFRSSGFRPNGSGSRGFRSGGFRSAGSMAGGFHSGGFRFGGRRR